MLRLILRSATLVAGSALFCLVLLAFGSAKLARASNAPAPVIMSVQHLCGVYRGIVESTADPLRKSRVRVRIPQANISGLWALPGSAPASLPAVGAQVWIMFEAGSSEYPIWFGSVPPG